LIVRITGNPKVVKLVIVPAHQAQFSSFEGGPCAFRQHDVRLQRQTVTIVSTVTARR
jgi:hypothetical protein